MKINVMLTVLMSVSPDKESPLVGASMVDESHLGSRYLFLRLAGLADDELEEFVPAVLFTRESNHSDHEGDVLDSSEVAVEMGDEYPYEVLASHLEEYCGISPGTHRSRWPSEAAKADL